MVSTHPNGVVLLIDPILKLTMEEMKRPFETWNVFFARVCGIDHELLAAMAQTPAGKKATARVELRKMKHEIKTRQPKQTRVGGDDESHPECETAREILT